MDQLSYSHDAAQAGGSYYFDNKFQSNGMDQIIGHSMGSFQPLSIVSHPILSNFLQTQTLQVQPIYTLTKSSSFDNLKATNDIILTKKEKLHKEIESDDFLREFFSISKKVDNVPSPKQMKEEYYSR